jgi:hypothetical protein
LGDTVIFYFPPAFTPISFLVFSYTLKTEMTRSSEAPIDFKGQLGVIVQKTEIFIATAAENLMALTVMELVT